MKNWILAFVVSCLIVGMIFVCVWFRPIGLFVTLSIMLFTILIVCMKQLIDAITEK